MKKGWGLGEKHASDPIGSDQARGKDSYRRKSGRDTEGFTPTELHQKAQLMRQFMNNPEGPGGNTDAYKDSEVWCRGCDGRRMNEEGLDSCRPCFLSQPSIFDVNTACSATPIESDLVPSSGQVDDSLPSIPQQGAEHEAAVRLALLALKSAASISPEDDARLKVATERLRKLLPRVAASDFETLVGVAEKVAASKTATNALRAELGLDD